MFGEAGSPVVMSSLMNSRLKVSDSSRLSWIIQNHQVKPRNWWNWTLLRLWPRGIHNNSWSDHFMLPSSRIVLGIHKNHPTLEQMSLEHWVSFPSGSLSRHFVFLLTWTACCSVINFPQGSIKVILILMLIAIVHLVFKAKPLLGNKRWRDLPKVTNETLTRRFRMKTSDVRTDEP